MVHFCKGNKNVHLHSIDCQLRQSRRFSICWVNLIFCVFVHRFHLTFAEDTLATIEEIAGGAVTELIEDEDKNASSTTYPTLTRYMRT